MELSGLPGTDGKAREARVFGSISEALLLIKYHSALLSAGDKGCINIWKDDAGQYRAEFQGRQVTCSRHEGRSKAKLGRWLREWFPKMGR